MLRPSFLLISLWLLVGLAVALHEAVVGVLVVIEHLLAHPVVVRLPKQL
jgi:hypothetical protein